MISIIEAAVAGGLLAVVASIETRLEKSSSVGIA
jgi:hypothetical protein